MQRLNTNPGSIFMVAAPSGAGKSTLVNAMLAKDANMHLSISYTTRPPRPDDVNGREYHFTTVADFLARKSKGEFVESAEVHGNYYGTSRTVMNEHIKAGTDVLLEVDWQGVQQIKAQYPHAVGIFILPPSIDALEQRLRKRGQDSEQVITRRLLAAGGEIAHAHEFEYVIINREFDEALSELVAIVKATRCRYNQQAAKNLDLFTQFSLHANLNE